LHLVGILFPHIIPATFTRTFSTLIKISEAAIAQSVQRLATGWTVRGSNPGGGGGTRFSAPVQTGGGVHPASCTMGTGSLPGVKRPGRGAEVKERVELYLYVRFGPSWHVIG